MLLRNATGFVGILAILLSSTFAYADIQSAELAVKELREQFEVGSADLDLKMKNLREGEEYKKAREKRDYDALRDLREAISKPFYEKWRGKVEVASAPYKGRDGELVFAEFCLENYYLLENRAEFVEALINNHAANAKLVNVAKYFRSMGRGIDRPQMMAALGKVIDENSNKECQAWAYYARGTYGGGRKASDEQKAKAKADLAAVVGLVGNDHILSYRARGPEFKKTRLQVGMKVPEITGPTVRGGTMKLSDFRGKVILLDFWGDW